MEKHFVTLSLILVTLISTAQQVKWSNESDLEITNTDGYELKLPGVDMIGFTDDLILRFHDSKPYNGYAYVKNDATLTIELYNARTLQTISTVSFRVKDYLDRDEHYYGVSSVNGEPVVIVFKKNPESGATDVYVRTLNPAPPHFGNKKYDLGMTDDYKLLSTNINSHIFSVTSQDLNVQGFYTIRKDSTGDGLIHTFKINNERTGSWQSYTHHTAGVKQFRPDYFVVGNNGNFAVAGFTSPNGVYGTHRTMSVICKFSDGQIQDIELDFEEQYLRSAAVLPLKTDQFLVFGHYNNKPGNGSKGWFTQVITKDDPGQITYELYDDTFVTELWSEQARQFEEENHASIPNYTWTGYPDIHEAPDSTKFIVFNVGQEKSVENLSYTTEKNPDNKKNLVVAKLDASGNLLWQKNIFVNNVTPSSMMIYYIGQSYYSYFFDNKIYILVNENYKGENKEIYKTRLFTIDADGNTEEIWSDLATAKGLVIDPSYCFEIEDNVLLLYAANKTAQRIGLLNLAN